MTQKNKSLSDSILEEISMKGLGFAKKPNYEIPSLPRDITELDDPALMDLFVQLSQWNDYASGLYAVACVNEREAESALETAQAIGCISGWTGAKGETATKVKAAAAASPEIQKLSKELNVFYAHRKLLESRTMDIERSAALVSRELTRRSAGSSGGFRTRQRNFTT